MKAPSKWKGGWPESAQPMDADDFHDFLKQQPFRPFRVTLTDGRAYDVTHSECALVGYSVVEIVFPAVGNRVTITLSHRVS
jgi:hypothetical protein